MNIRGAEFRDNLYSRDFSSEALFWVALPLISGIFLLIILIISLVKNKKAKRAISLLLCMSMMGLTMTIPGYASDLYNEDGSVNQEVFDKNWEKYSDIVPVIPLDQRSYEARKYGEAEQEIERLYSLMYQTAANQELNRLNYIDLVDYKKAVDTIHKKNLIKSTIRLAAFTGYTINDSIGKGKTFAVNILKSGATYVTQIGDVLTVTSDFVTESYKESFGVLQKAYKYTTSDNITKEILDDMKSDVKDKVSMKINDTIDEAIGRKRIPDYKVDDLKITKDDVQILKFFYEKSRELENAILQNRKVNTSYEKKIDNIVEKIQLEMNKLDKFKKAEKERLFYSLSKNPPENAPQDDEESIGILDENTPQEGEDYSDDSDDTWSDEIDIEEPIEDYNTDDLVGTWNGISTIMEISSTLGLVDDDWMQLEQFIGQSEDVSVDIYKEGDIYIYKHGDLKMRLEQNGKNIHIDRGYFTESNEDVEMNLVADLTGEVNDLNSEMILDTVLRFDIKTEENSGSIDLVLKMELFK